MKPALVFKKHDFNKNYSAAIKYEDTRLADELILSELKNIIKNHRQEVINLLKAYKYKVEQNVGTKRLINLTFDGFKNKDFRENIAVLINRASKTSDNISYSVDGQGNTVPDLKKSEDNWYYNQQTVETISKGLEDFDKKKKERLETMLNVPTNSTILGFVLIIGVVGFIYYYYTQKDNNVAAAGI